MLRLQRLDLKLDAEVRLNTFMRTHRWRVISFATFVFAAFSLAGSQTNAPAQPPATAAKAPAGNASAVQPSQIIEFLSRTIAWYRELPVQQQLATEPADLTYVQENRTVANQVVQLAFDYARAQAQAQPKPVKGNSDQAQPSQQYQRLTQMAQKTDQDLEDTQKELQDTRDKLVRATAAKRKLLEAQVNELESEINLLEARRDALNTMV